MIACPACRSANPDRAKFCMECGARLADAGGASQERKVITVLFCDLVGFTALSEQTDHEDVDAMLNAYADCARAIIEGHGGTVEKFIGDAVVGVFGVPTAHEDDAERAVRAGLKIVADVPGLRWPGDLPLSVRVGVNTGESFVHLDVSPGSGRTFITGDVVNTAARLQAVADRGTVVVGELTARLSRRSVSYEELKPVRVKGKTTPLPVWRALGPVSRTGIRTSGAVTTPFLGRRGDLSVVVKWFEAARSSGLMYCGLLVGEPGIGKSRLVLEFARSLEQRPELATWRQGRCQPFGEGVAFAPLSEIVKAHAGILDSDDVRTVEAKLDDVLPDGEDRAWLRQRLRPLLGLEAAPATLEESFAAWRAFFIHVAGSGPTVIVLEDLHWADEALLTFLDSLAADPPRAPLLVLSTTRPELMQRRPDTLRPAKNVGRRALSPLNRKDAGRLVTALFDRRLAAEVRAPVMERIGGNPLYAEEYVRLLLERDLLVRTQGMLRLQEGRELPMPDTVQAVLAARLDTLPEEHKALLCDAAIFGESFWGSGVATLAGREATVVDGIMSCLTQRQLVRPVVSSSLEGESEYLFWHALTRDVAYGELPRRVRVDKHIGAADWLEGRAADRVDEFAGVLAHHYLTAHDLAQDLRRPEQAAAVAPRAGHYLWRAVCRKRASGSGENDNRTQLERALELLPPDAVQRPHVLFMLGESVSWDRPSDAIAYYQEALPGLRARGPANAAAGCAVQLAECLGACGMEGGPALVEESSRLIDERDLSPDLVYALQELAAARLVLLPVSDSAKSVDMADRALRAADRFGMPPPPGALGWRGGARCYLGDAGGLDDFVSAIEQARTQGNGPHLVLLTHNYGCTLRPWKGPATALASFRSARAMAGERDMEMVVLSSKAYEIGCLAALGEWDSALEQARALLPALRASNSLEGVAQVEAAQATILCARGAAHEATELADRLSEAARAGSIQPEVVALAYAAAALVRGATGRREEALELLHECLTAGGWLENAEPEMVRTALTCGERALAERLRGLLARESPLHRHALAATSGLLAEADGALEAAAGDYATAVAGWHEYGWVYEEGMALLGQGRCLELLGQESVAASVLRQAGRIFERLQARPSLRVARSLLRQAGAEQAES